MKRGFINAKLEANRSPLRSLILLFYRHNHFIIFRCWENNSFMVIIRNNGMFVGHK